MKASIFFFFLLCTMAMAQDGALSLEEISKIQKDFVKDKETKVIQNIVTTNSIDSLVVDFTSSSENDTHFTHTVPYAGIRNQSASGRCWIFSGLNCLRTKVMKDKKEKDFKLSASYLSFWDKMEKANLFLERAINLRDKDFLDREWMYVLEHSLSEGGWWNYATGLIDKYGVVPDSAMPETKSSQNSGTMNSIYITYLKKCAVDIRQGKQKLEDLRKYKQSALKNIYRFLVINLGEPPKTFKYLVSAKEIDKPVYKNFSPQAFYKEYIGLDLNDYVCLFDNPSVPYNKYYTYSLSKAMYEKDDFSYVNLPANMLKEACKESILNKEAVWFAADVGKDQLRDKGLMKAGINDYGKLFNLDLEISKADRLKTLSGAPNHAMVLVGMDLQKDGSVKKWLVENSWGTKIGIQGKWHLYDNWFNEYVYAVIINKKYLAENVRKLFETKAQELSPWHP